MGQNLSQQNQAVAASAAQYREHMAQNEIARRQLDNEVKMRNAEAILNYQQLQLAEQEANASATQQKMEIAREMQKAKALTRLASLESGVSGNSVDRLDVDMGFTQGQKNAVVETNRVSQIDQLEAEKLATQMKAQVQPLYTYDGEKPKVGLSGFLGAALSGLGGYVSAGGLDRSKYNAKVSETAPYNVYNSRIK